MDPQVIQTKGGPRLVGPAMVDIDVINRFLSHLDARGFSPATVRAYAFDVLNFLRFCTTCGLTFADVQPVDLFDYLDWQARPATAGQRVVRLAGPRGAAPATMNRRISAVRGLSPNLPARPECRESLPAHQRLGHHPARAAYRRDATAHGRDRHHRHRALARPRERRDHPDLPSRRPRQERAGPRQNQAHRSPTRTLQDQGRHTALLPGVLVIMPTSQPPTGP